MGISFFRKDDRLYVNIPAGADTSFPDLVKTAREKAGRDMAVDFTALKEAFLHARGRDFPFASPDPTEAQNEKLKIRFSPDFITAFLILYPPKGRGRKLGEPEVRELIAAYGVDDDLMDLRELRTALMRREYGEPFVVAMGAKPVDSEAYSVSWDAPPTDPEGFLESVSGNHDAPPQVLRVVRPAQVAGKRIKPLPGRPGYTVRGETIEPKPSDDPFHLGEGLRVSPNGAMILSTARGHLKISGVHGTHAEVVPVLELEGMAGIDEIAKAKFFPGSVIINGDVESAAVLKVMGDLEIRGALIGAGVEVCGSLIVRDGIINNNKLGIIAGGIVSAGFFERARVWAKTIHIRRYSLHSALLALDSIVGSPSCSVNGGDAEAASRFEVAVLGSANASPTRIALGVRPALALRDVYKAWVAALERQTSTDAAVARFIEAEKAKFQKLHHRTGLKVRFDDAYIRATSVNPGVKIAIGGGLREVGEKIGAVRFTAERIGDKERVAMAKL